MEIVSGMRRPWLARARMRGNANLARPRSAVTARSKFAPIRARGLIANSKLEWSAITSAPVELPVGTGSAAERACGNSVRPHVNGIHVPIAPAHPITVKTTALSTRLIKY